MVGNEAVMIADPEVMAEGALPPDCGRHSSGSTHLGCRGPPPSKQEPCIPSPATRTTLLGMLAIGEALLAGSAGPGRHPLSSMGPRQVVRVVGMWAEVWACIPQPQQQQPRCGPGCLLEGTPDNASIWI